MKSGEQPNINFNNVEKFEGQHHSREIDVYIEFSNKTDFVEEFKAMAEKISDDTLIEILRARDEEYIAEEYR